MSEEVIVSNSPSQLLNLKSFVLSILTIVVIVLFYNLGKERFNLNPLLLLLCLLPVISSVWKFFQIKCCKYELTNERLKIITGVLNRDTEEIELYRVKDFSLNEPFFLRVFKLGNIHIESSDKSLPFISIKALPRAQDFKEQLRACVEEIRTKKNVREVDFE